MFKRKKNKAVVEESVVNNETKNIEMKEEKLDSRNPDFSGFSVEEDKGIRKSESIKEIVKEEQKENEETKTDKKDIEKFFVKSKEKQKKLKRKEVRRNKKDSKKKSKDRKHSADLASGKYYKYKKTKFTKVEDFVKFLNDHYIDMDIIAKVCLEDENFHNWLSKRSGVYLQSVKEFKEIKEIIEK